MPYLLIEKQEKIFRLWMDIIRFNELRNIFLFARMLKETAEKGNIFLNGSFYSNNFTGKVCEFH